MKKQFYFLLAFFGIVKSEVSSKTYFSVPPLVRPGMPQLVGTTFQGFNEVYPRQSFDLTVVGSSSRNSEDLAKYFLPFGKSSITAGGLGATVTKDENVDIIANYFGVLTAPALTTSTTPDTIDNLFANYKFESTLSFAPYQKMFGFVPRYKRHLSEFTDKGWWVELMVPIVWVKNDLQLKEEIVAAGGPTGKLANVPKGFVADMKAAFKQESLIYGKIDGPRTKAGIADIFVTFGFDYVKEPTHQLTSFFGGVIPTGNKPNAEYLFEPVVGNGGHLGIFSGATAGFRIWCKGDKSIYWKLDTVGIAQFENSGQRRSFDLKGKPWSRYMWVYLDSKTSGTNFGIHTFTEPVKVKPGTMRDLNLAFIFSGLHWKCEGGYHFFAREAESVSLASGCWNKGAAIAAITEPYSGVDSQVINKGKSRNNATINRYARVDNDMNAAGTEVYKELTEADFDFDSAAHPAIVSHTSYFEITYSNCMKKYLKLGGAYEFASDNAALKRWYAWLRCGIEF